MKRHVVDLNCDLGEGAGDDAAILPLISSANIACGGHAGDDESMRRIAALAKAHGVAIGAHPGFADREHFGRRELALRPREITQLVFEQVARLRAIAPVRHVKPHGALYHLAARDARTAEAIVAAVQELDPALLLFALSGGELARIGREAGLGTIEEVFADRTYRADGTLTPRAEAGALVADPGAAAARAVKMIARGRVDAVGGGEITITPGTICVHGDGIHALETVRALRAAFASAGIEVRAPAADQIS